jgi:glycosyltransferase involved in cell wall biosynthesis
MSILLSIIVATRNSALRLPILFESLLKTCLVQNLEILVADGSSSDRTVDCCNHYSLCLPINIISTTDTGIYDAWNKAVPHAKGLWTMFLGDDDCIFDEDHFNSALLLASDINLTENIDFLIFSSAFDYPRSSSIHKPSYHYNHLWRGMKFAHPSTFIKTTILQSTRFDTSYTIASDYKFFLLKKLNVLIYDRIVLVFIGSNGVSKTRRLLLAKEVFILHTKIFTNPIKILYLPLRIFISSWLNSLLRICPANLYLPSHD